MMELPLAVAIAALIQDQKILLIKRAKGSYVGLWGLPGGKIEKSEHVSDAAQREIFEETGIKADFVNHLGFVSEHLREKGVIHQHFLLHLCELKPQTTTFVSGREGALQWFLLSDLSLNKKQIIPSDYVMIEKMVLEHGKNYYNCVVEKNGEEHVIQRFE